MFAITLILLSVFTFQKRIVERIIKYRLLLSILQLRDLNISLRHSSATKITALQNIEIQHIRLAVVSFSDIREAQVQVRSI